MSEDLFDNGEAFEEGLAPQSTEHLNIEVRTNFWPWHKPRKQWVRTEQWAASIATLVDHLELSQHQHPLTYLSLPGQDLLDIRTIQPICVNKNIELQFLGLNDDENNDESSALLSAGLLNQVRSLPNINQASDIVADKFEQLAQPKSIAYERVLLSRQSYDVINIDLCRSVAEGESGVKGPTLTNAIHKLLRHQAESRKSDWLLFLTTRTNSDMVDKDTMQRFVGWINALIKEEPELLNSMLEQKLIEAQHLNNNEIQAESLSPIAFTSVFALGISHWVCHTLFSCTPKWRVDMLPLYGYHVAMIDNSCDMISLGFYCKRISTPVQDEFGVAVDSQIGVPESPEETYKKCKKKIHKQVTDTDDLDVKLHIDQDLYQRCVVQSAELLASAKYDPDKYKEWAENERQKLSDYLQKFSLISI